jgi:N-acetylglucosaminyldiphosphoundecaprenol N-acetyl-beta-D-mannosaminyltransferase
MAANTSEPNCRAKDEYVLARPAPGRRSHPTAFIRGLPMNLSSKEYVLEEIERAVRERETGHYITITNPEIMYHGLRKPDVGENVRNSDFSLCDGVGIIYAGLAWGVRVPRFNGPILQLLASEYGVPRGWRHFFYGGKPGVADKLADKLKEKYPGLIVCGTYCPPFGDMSAEEDAKVVETINEAKPDIVWVGLSVPAKERWVSAHLGRLNVPWIIGVGAAFDYHSGAIPWAPAPIRAIGMEWLFRLILEPRLRAKRYWWHLIYCVETLLIGLFTGRFLTRQHITKCRDVAA